MAGVSKMWDAILESFRPPREPTKIHLLLPLRSAHRSHSRYATYVHSVDSVLSSWPLTLRRFSHGLSTSRCGLIFFRPSGMCCERRGDLMSRQAHDSQP